LCFRVALCSYLQFAAAAGFVSSADAAALSSRSSSRALSPLQVWRRATAVNYSKLLATGVINNAVSDVTDDVTDAATNDSRHRSAEGRAYTVCGQSLKPLSRRAPPT